LEVGVQVGVDAVLAGVAVAVIVFAGVEEFIDIDVASRTE
jgi:hypothetical protein